MSILDKLLEKAETAVLTEGDVLLSPEDEKEFVSLKAVIDDDLDAEETPEEIDENPDMGDPMLVALNVLSIVSTKPYPYGGFVDDEDEDEVKGEWGGTSVPNPYSEQDEDDE